MSDRLSVKACKGWPVLTLDNKVIPGQTAISVDDSLYKEPEDFVKVTVVFELRRKNVFELRECFGLKGLVE